VTIVETRDVLGFDMGEQQGTVLRERVRAHPSSDVRLNSTVEQIAADHVALWSAATNETTLVAASLVVLASRLESERTLADELAAAPGLEIHVVGDAAQPRRLADALLEGARVAAAL
jgi:hypothetical protein